MPVGLQLMFTRARTARFTGYQFTAETPGATPEERQAIELYSTPSGLVGPGTNFRRATTVYSLPTGRVAISRLGNIGVGYDGRPDCICTHTIVLETADYLGLRGRLAWAAELLRPDPALRGELPALPVPEASSFPPIAWDALQRWVPDADRAAAALSCLLRTVRLVLVDRAREEDDLPAVEELLSLLPLHLRGAVSLCTFDVQSEPARPYRLLVLPEKAPTFGLEEEGIRVVRLTGAPEPMEAPSPYAAFAAGGVYGPDADRLRRFLRFAAGFDPGPYDVDALFAYWSRLEQPPREADPATLAGYELDLAEMAITVAPDRAPRHLTSAASQLRGSPAPPLAARALFGLLPRAVPTGERERAVELARRYLEPYVERRDASGLAAIVALGAPLLAGAPSAETREVVTELVAAVRKVLAEPGATPAGGPARAELLEALLAQLDVIGLRRALEMPVLLALAGSLPTGDRPTDLRVARRLEQTAEALEPGANRDRLLQLASAGFHQAGDALAELGISLRNLRAPPSEGAAAAVARLRVPPSAAWQMPPRTKTDRRGTSEAAAAPAGPASGASGESAERAPSGPPSEGAPPGGEEPTTVPPSVRAIVALYRHAAEHPGADPEAALRELCAWWRRSQRAPEGLLALADGLPEITGSGSDTARRDRLATVVDRELLVLAAEPTVLRGSPTPLLWACWRVLDRWTERRRPLPPPLAESLAAALDRAVALEVPAPPLAAWDVAVALSLQPWYLHLPGPDVSAWLATLTRAPGTSTDPSVDPLRETLATARAWLVEAAQTPRAPVAPASLSDRLSRAFRADPLERAVRQIDALDAWVAERRPAEPPAPDS